MFDRTFFERHFLIVSIGVSAVIHLLAIFWMGAWRSAPRLCVLNGPNSLQVTAMESRDSAYFFSHVIKESRRCPYFPMAPVDSGEPFPRRGTKSQSSEALRKTADDLSVESRGSVTPALALAQVNPAPLYPRLARQRGWEGLVRIKVFVDQNGAARRVEVGESSGYDVLDQSALKTVKSWRFSPARSGPDRVSSIVTIPIQFALLQDEN